MRHMHGARWTPRAHRLGGCHFRGVVCELRSDVRAGKRRIHAGSRNLATEEAEAFGVARMPLRVMPRALNLCWRCSVHDKRAIADG